EVFQKLMFDDEDETHSAQVEDFEDDPDTDAEDEPAQERIGKDKTTKWRKVPRSRKRRAEPHNLITRLPGVIHEARRAKLPVECWSHIYSDEILQTIVKYTNQYIHLKVRHRFDRQRDENDLDLTELKAFLGLLYLAGTLHANRMMLEDLWGTDGHGVEIFQLVMNLKRFEFLMRCLRFDDSTTRL
ncbi:hypothetical protein NQ314_014779, partial [Rhamnusium bicolor]